MTGALKSKKNILKNNKSLNHNRKKYQSKKRIMYGGSGNNIISNTYKTQSEMLKDVGYTMDSYIKLFIEKDLVDGAIRLKKLGMKDHDFIYKILKCKKEELATELYNYGFREMILIHYLSCDHPEYIEEAKQIKLDFRDKTENTIYRELLTKKDHRSSKNRRHYTKSKKNNKHQEENTRTPQTKANSESTPASEFNHTNNTNTTDTDTNTYDKKSEMLKDVGYTMDSYIKLFIEKDLVDGAIRLKKLGMKDHDFIYKILKCKKEELATELYNYGFREMILIHYLSCDHPEYIEEAKQIKLDFRDKTENTIYRELLTKKDHRSSKNRRHYTKSKKYYQQHYNHKYKDHRSSNNRRQYENARRQPQSSYSSSTPVSKFDINTDIIISPELKQKINEDLNKIQNETFTTEINEYIKNPSDKLWKTLLMKYHPDKNLHNEFKTLKTQVINFIKTNI